MTSLSQEMRNKKLAGRYAQNTPLSRGQAIYWIFASFEQSKNLAGDAGHLYRKGSHATALNLVILAQEELAKPSILVKYMARGIGDQKNWHKARKQLLDHGSKIEEALELYLNFLKRKGRNHSYGVLRAFKKMEFNPIQALKSTREASIYTFAHEGAVLVPYQIGILAKPVVPSYVEIISDLASQLIGLIRVNFPKLYRSMTKVFYADSEQEASVRWKEYEVEIEKYLYAADFLSKFFPERKDLFQSLVTEKRLHSAMRRICAKRAWRKYRVFFELIKNDPAYPAEKRVQILFHPKLPALAAGVFRKAKSKGLLLRD